MLIMVGGILLLVFASFILRASNLLYRAINEILNGVWNGSIMFVKICIHLIKFAFKTSCLLFKISKIALRAGRVSYRLFKSESLNSAQHVHAIGYGCLYRWRRAYIAQALRERRNAERRLGKLKSK